MFSTSKDVSESLLNVNSKKKLIIANLQEKSRTTLEVTEKKL